MLIVYNHEFVYFAAPKFEVLVPPRSDTDKRIEALLELPIPERTFNLDITESSTEHSEASMSMGKKSAYNFIVPCFL